MSELEDIWHDTPTERIRKLERETLALRGGNARLRRVLRELVECLDLADANNDLPISLVGHGRVFIERAKTELAQS